MTTGLPLNLHTEHIVIIKTKGIKTMLKIGRWESERKFCLNNWASVVKKKKNTHLFTEDSNHLWSKSSWEWIGWGESE